MSPRHVHKTSQPLGVLLNADKDLVVENLEELPFNRVDLVQADPCEPSPGAVVERDIVVDLVGEDQDSDEETLLGSLFAGQALVLIPEVAHNLVEESERKDNGARG